MSHLPVELCHMIVSHFADDRQTLLSLLLVSRNFLHEACRFLYRTICIHRDQAREHLPLSNSTERTYYASLVRSLTIDLRTVSHTSLQHVLSSTTNLEDLHFTSEFTHNDVLGVLRWKYPFQLKKLTIHARLHPVLLAFFKTQPAIERLAWDPIHSPAQCLPLDVDLFPKLRSLKTWGSAVLDSPWFIGASSVRHLWLSAARGGYVDLHRQPCEESKRLTSLRLHKFVQRTQVNLISTLFPNLQYLDARFMEFSDLRTCLCLLRSLKKLWIYWCFSPTDIIDSYPSLEYLVVGAKGSAVQYRRDAACSSHPEKGDQEWLNW